MVNNDPNPSSAITLNQFTKHKGEQGQHFQQYLHYKDDHKKKKREGGMRKRGEKTCGQPHSGAS